MLPTQPSTIEYGQAPAYRPPLSERTDWQLTTCNTDSATKVYRIGKLKSTDYKDHVYPHVCNYSKLSFKEAARPIVPTLEWKVHLQTDETFYEQTVKPHVVDQKKTCLITGPPGCGKTWKFLKPLAEALRAQGENVKIIALTHVAARNAGGQTAHSFVHRFVTHGTYEGWLFIDEISMMPLSLLAALATLDLGKIKIVCFGDWDQIPPINNSWRGSPVEARIFRDSRLMKTWCDCTVFRLTENVRCDKAHFDWYCRIPGMDLESAKAAARARHGAGVGSAQWNLVKSHYRRMQLNDTLQTAATRAYLAAGGADLVRVVEEEEEERKKKRRRVSLNRAQPYDLWPGTRLIGSDNENTHIVNGALLDVTGVDVDRGVVRLCDVERKVEFELTAEQVAKHTRLRWAVTYPTMQGRTTDETVRLWDLDSRHFTLEDLYIGVSRVSRGENVSVA